MKLTKLGATGITVALQSSILVVAMAASVGPSTAATSGTTANVTVEAQVVNDCAFVDTTPVAMNFGPLSAWNTRNLATHYSASTSIGFACTPGSAIAIKLDNGPKLAASWNQFSRTMTGRSSGNSGKSINYTFAVTADSLTATDTNATGNPQLLNFAPQIAAGALTGLPAGTYRDDIVITIGPDI